MPLKGLRDIKTCCSVAREERRIRVTRNLHEASLPRELFLESKVRLHQIEVIQDLLEEMLQAIAEGIPGAKQEFERLTKKLAELKAG